MREGHEKIIKVGQTVMREKTTRIISMCMILNWGWVGVKRNRKGLIFLSEQSKNTNHFNHVQMVKRANQ